MSITTEETGFGLPPVSQRSDILNPHGYHLSRSNRINQPTISKSRANSSFLSRYRLAHPPLFSARQAQPGFQAHRLYCLCSKRAIRPPPSTPPLPHALRINDHVSHLHPLRRLSTPSPTVRLLHGPSALAIPLPSHNGALGADARHGKRPTDIHAIPAHRSGT